MPISQNSFDLQQSELVRLFSRRGGQDGGTAETTMTSLVENIRHSANLKGFVPSLEPLLELRRILSLQYVDDLGCDGAIHPLGVKYEDGFKILVKGKCSPHRIRFTVAHEICHTLFYEIAPEVKFSNHDVDPTEERLCNIGAAAILIPAVMLKRQARGLAISFDSLEKLSSLFNVSQKAMLLRLRFIKIWGAELSEWHLLTNGEFSMHRIVGGRKAEWKWCDSGLLRKAWDTGQVLCGRTYIECRDADGCLKVRAVSYELKRRGDALFALWSHPSIRRTPPKMPLFESPLRLSTR
jgi:hypothetical protein